MRGQIGYADALKILGVGHSKVLAVIDRLLGGAILGAAAATAQVGLLGLLGARDELVSRSSELLSNLGQRARGARGEGRTDLLVAAHAVIAVNAYFEALRQAELPLDVARLRLTAAEQAALAGAGQSGDAFKLVEAMIEAAPPLPTAYRPFELTVLEMKAWYEGLSVRLIEFMSGLAVWAALDETHQSRMQKDVAILVPPAAAERYEENYRRLAAECPEFSMWMYLTDSAASRKAIELVSDEIDTGFAGLQSLLKSLTSASPAEWPARLASAYGAQLGRPIAETAPGEALAGLVVPLLGTGYINPRFRVDQYRPDARPAEEDWWRDAELCDDVQWFLAGHLTSPTAVEVPLVLLGQPGSGKSLLTKVLAARLPPEDYLPVRVELRHADADAPLQDQIESALKKATGERMEWPDLVRHAGDALPVVMLDGFDELLQSTGVSHSGYLEQVRDFQRREADQGRRVAFIVTSRTVVADRVRFPDGTVVAKMESFDDSQIGRWLAIWNEANEAYFSSTQPALRALPIEAVLPHRALAEQPLLLLMLSFYDANGNALQQHSDELARAELYERLLSMFVEREIDKLHVDASKEKRDALAAAELDELSVVAFAMFNRGRKSISGIDLDGDLAALVPPDASSATDPASRMARRLSRAQLAIGRFFFIHRSQALVDDTRLNDYEFLHATFGEYLVARLVSQILDHLVEQSRAERPSWAVSSGSGPQDDRLWDLLSFAPMADGSQILGFLGELIRGPAAAWMTGLRAVLVELFRRSLQPRQRGYDGYEPRRQTVPSRHAAYSANLLLLNALASEGDLHGSALFGTQDGVVDSWRSFALLWRSQLEPAGWDGLLNALSVSRGPSPAAGEVLIHLGTGVRLDKPIEHYRTVNWLASGVADPAAGDYVATDIGVSAEKTAWQAEFLCAPDFDLLVHALQPVLRLGPAAFKALISSPDGAVQSALHLALRAIVESAGLPGTSGDALWTAQSLLSVTDQMTMPRNAYLPIKSSKPDFSKISVQGMHYTLTTPIFGKMRGAVGSGGTPADSSDRFAALKLYTSGYTGTTKILKTLPALADIKPVYESVNPIELAAEEPIFIDRVLRLAQERKLDDWAAVQGLVLLVTMSPDKLAKLDNKRVEFVLRAAARDSAQLRLSVVHALRTRYNEAKSPRGTRAHNR